MFLWIPDMHGLQWIRVYIKEQNIKVIKPIDIIYKSSWNTPCPSMLTNTQLCASSAESTESTDLNQEHFAYSSLWVRLPIRFFAHSQQM